MRLHWDDIASHTSRNSQVQSDTQPRRDQAETEDRPEPNGDWRRVMVLHKVLRLEWPARTMAKVPEQKLIDLVMMLSSRIDILISGIDFPEHAGI